MLVGQIYINMHPSNSATPQLKCPYVLLGPCPSRGAVCSQWTWDAVTVSIIGSKHYKFWCFLLCGQHSLVAIVTYWLPRQHRGFHDKTVDLVSFLNTSLAANTHMFHKIGQYRALKWYFHYHSNHCQGNWTYKFWCFLLCGQHSLVAMVTYWLPRQHRGFHDKTVDLVSFLNTSLAANTHMFHKIGQYRALKWYFHYYSNHCQVTGPK